jgi:hypothetical protein
MHLLLEYALTGNFLERRAALRDEHLARSWRSSSGRTPTSPMDW